MAISKLYEDSFTWSRWRAFNLFKELGMAARYTDIIRFRNVLKLYAVGYVHAEILRCRPKHDCYAVMFLKDGVFSWCHFTRREFNETFEQS
jgi:hypothetical protein